MEFIRISVGGRQGVVSRDPWTATVCALVSLEDPRVNEVLNQFGVKLVDASVDARVLWPVPDEEDSDEAASRSGE